MSIYLLLAYWRKSNWAQWQFYSNDLTAPAMFPSGESTITSTWWFDIFEHRRSVICITEHDPWTKYNSFWNKQLEIKFLNEALTFCFLMCREIFLSISCVISDGRFVRFADNTQYASQLQFVSVNVELYKFQESGGHVTNLYFAGSQRSRNVTL